MWRLLVFLTILSFIPSFQSLPLSPEPLPPHWPIWLAIERVLPSAEGDSDAVLLRPEFCHRSCAELLGDDAQQVHRARCVCRCPPNEPVFVQHKGQGKCAQKVPECPGRLIHWEHPQNSRPQFAPALGLPQKGESLGGELRIAWRESGVKVRQSQGPRCTVKSAHLLGNKSEWNVVEKLMFQLGWANANGQVLWSGSDSDAQQLAGGIVRLELDCAAGKSGNATFCIAFRVEGQIEAPAGVGKAPPGAVGIELERGHRAEVVIIILLAILLFLSLFGSLFLWHVCWRVHKRKLVHTLQMQFLHYARQEKEKAISECQLRYQALVKAAAGMRNADSNGHGATTPFAISHIGIGNGGGILPNPIENSIPMDGPQQTLNGRRKLYFSAEFFEPQLMTNPPPMAEQFLYDLRKMISVARDRIRTRRHVPRLAPVNEDENEDIGGNGANKMGKPCEDLTQTEEIANASKSMKNEEVPMDEEEAKDADEELALSMEEIVEEQQKRRGSKGGEIDQKEEQENPDENINSSPRTSLDSGQGGSEKHEEEPGRKPDEINEEDDKVFEEKEESKESAAEETVKNEAPKQESGVEKLPTEMQHWLHPAVGQMAAQSSVQPAPSRIPVGTASTSKSPRLPLKFTALCRRPPPLPPRPPPSPPTEKTDEPKGKHPKIVGKNLLFAAKRRVESNKDGDVVQQPSLYAVCPPPSFACSDRMKKSLPRRKKAIVPQPIGLPPNSAVLPKAAPMAM